MWEVRRSLLLWVYSLRWCEPEVVCGQCPHHDVWPLPHRGSPRVMGEGGDWSGDHSIWPEIHLCPIPPTSCTSQLYQPLRWLFCWSQHELVLFTCPWRSSQRTHTSSPPRNSQSLAMQRLCVPASGITGAQYCEINAEILTVTPGPVSFPSIKIRVVHRALNNCLWLLWHLIDPASHFSCLCPWPSLATGW